MQVTAKSSIRRVGTALGVAALLLMSVGASTALASEWVPLVKFPVKVTGKGGVTTFESELKNKVICIESKSMGTIKNAAEATATVTYEKCELKVVNPVVFGEACPNIVTKELSVEPLSELNKVAGKTGVVFKSVVGAITEFVCAGVNKVKVTVTGSVICQTEIINVFTKANRIICKKGALAGEQEFTEGKNVAKVFIKAALKVEAAFGIFKINEKASQETTEEVKYENAVGGAEEVKQTP